MSSISGPGLGFTYRNKSKTRIAFIVRVRLGNGLGRALWQDRPSATLRPPSAGRRASSPIPSVGVGPSTTVSIARLATTPPYPGRNSRRGVEGKAMGSIRFRKSIKIAPGIRMSVSKRGFGLSAGVRGAHIRSTPRVAGRQRSASRAGHFARLDFLLYRRPFAGASLCAVRPNGRDRRPGGQVPPEGGRVCEQG